jgi:hypothetical protein
MSFILERDLSRIPLEAARDGRHGERLSCGTVDLVRVVPERIGRSFPLLVEPTSVDFR